MNKQKIIAEIKQQFMLKRIHAQEVAERNLNELLKNKEFNSIYSEYNLKNIEYLKSTYETENLDLKKDLQILRQKINEFLKKNKIDVSSLKPKYECEICKDTGMVEGKICSCLNHQINMKISKMCSTQSNFKSFKDCDVKLLTEDDKKAFKLLNLWCTKYPDTNIININIVGGAGCGKTFMLECVASAMMRKNYVVCFKTAFELNELARLYHMGKSYEFSDLLTTDFLLIDDLGTEPILKNVTKEYLYNLINTRQINNLPTLITTNLSPDNLLDRYDERIFSRLANKNLSLNISLTSKDKRVK